jgi:hypothetical protein
MTTRTERLYVWWGVAGMALMFGGLLFARLLPPPSPSESAGRIASFYRHDATSIRWGSIIMMLGAACLGPWIAVMTKLIKKIEGPSSPTAYCQLALGALLILELIFPIMILEVAVLRPGRAPSEILLLSDLSWVLFLGIAYTFVVELLVTALAVFHDRREHPVFPRWIAPFNVAIAALSLPGAVIVVTTTGPFAWNGLLGFWVPGAAFGSWATVMTVVMLRAVSASDSDEAVGAGRMT